MHSSDHFHSTVLREKVATKRRYIAAAIYLLFVTQPSAASSGGLFLNGKLNGYFMYLQLDGYGTKSKGSVFGSGSWKCVPGKGGLTVTDSPKGAFMNWEKDGDRIKIVSKQEDSRGHNKTITSFLTKTVDSAGIMYWYGKDVSLDGLTGDFEAKSSAQADIAIALMRFCDDNIEDSGTVVVITKPELIEAAKKYFKQHDWKRITLGEPISAPSPAKNVFVLDLPVGSEQRVINQLKESGLVYDAGRLSSEVGPPARICAPTKR
jgi:hypothetical protein